jgi:deoxyribodipyrimidine photo-lyase
MTDSMIHPDRVKPLNDREINRTRDYVLYWMQQSQRTHFNHALEFAVTQANELRKPLVVCFGLMDDYPEANLRHYAFMLEGLRDVNAALREREIKFVVRHGHPQDVATGFGERACLVVCDRGYLRHQRAWRKHVAERADVSAMQVESEVVVPVEAASNKHEIGARTLRPKIHRVWDRYLVSVNEEPIGKPSLRLDIEGDLDPSDPTRLLGRLKLDTSVNPTPFFTGGQNEANRLMTTFLASKLDGYAEQRNEPSDDHHSYMSPYLHFGQVSPIDLALRARNAKKLRPADRDSFLEELIIRRELSMNFCHFREDYDAYSSVPDWARRSLAKHSSDERPVLYELKELEGGKSRDPYWNAAQMQMVITGFMHNYMRMYWGKKIIEWSKSPEQAFDIVRYLNNKYFLDGRDANSFANIGWLFGLHDRPWTERPIFGQIRYMNAAGLERKFDIQKYVEQMDDLARQHLGHGIDGGRLY